MSVVDVVKVYGIGVHSGLDNQRETDGKLADLLDSIAAGNTVRLGEFSKNGGENGDLNWADTLACQLEEIVLALREGRLQIM